MKLARAIRNFSVAFSIGVVVLALSSTFQHAFAQTAQEYIQNSLGGTVWWGNLGNHVRSVSLSCSELRLSDGKEWVTVPVKLIDAKEAFGEVVVFSCIAGGGCISSSSSLTGAGNSIKLDRLGAPGTAKSLVKAWEAYQDTCGGKIKRPF